MSYLGIDDEGDWDEYEYDDPDFLDDEDYDDEPDEMIGWDGSKLTAIDDDEDYKP